MDERALENEVYDLLRHPVGCAEVNTGDHHEAQNDRGGLRDLRTIGPLHALQLGPRGAQKRHGARRQRVAVLAALDDALDLLLLGHRAVAGALLDAPERHAARAAHERGVELVDLARGVLERAGKIGAVDLGVRGLRRAPQGASLATLLGAFAVTGHSALPR